MSKGKQEQMDTEKLIKALDNEENSYLMNLTNKKIKKIKLDILKELNLTRNELLLYLEKLKDYRYVDEMNEMKYGTYIRWITIADPDDIQLTTGGIFCDLKIMENGVYIICKNFSHKHFQVKLDECLIFQKLTNQEKVLLSALDYLDTSS